MDKLSAETRMKLRSTQILTSLATIVSELLQNAIDAGASQIDIGVDCAEWGCWAMDNGSGFTKDGLHTIGQDSEHGRYNSSKAYTPATLDAVSTFGFRGEGRFIKNNKHMAHIHVSHAALSSMADLCCMEISSRTARSRESWSIIVKAGKVLYIGPSIRWRRESPGTVVSIRDAFFGLPVRRQSHPPPNKTIELIRQELEAYALMFPNIAFSLEDASKAKEGHHLHRSHVLKIPKVTIDPFLAPYIHITLPSRSRLVHLLLHSDICMVAHSQRKCVEEVAATSGQLQIEGFISLVGAHTKSYQFLYINRHPISFCDLHRLIDSRFAASTFAKHAYDEGGETTLRPSARRSPRKGEKKPVYVLNLIIPVKHIDNCLEPSKSAVELGNKNVVTSFLSATIQSFLIHHKFVLDKRRNETAQGGSPRKKPKFVPENSTDHVAPPGPDTSERSGIPNVFVHMGNMPVVDVQKMEWKDPSTKESFIIDGRTGNSYSQGFHCTVGTGGPAEASSKRRPLQAPQTPEENANNINNTGDYHMPNWLQEALQANDAFVLQQPKILSLPLVNPDTGSEPDHNCHAGFLTGRATSSRCLQPGSSNFAAFQIRFQKNVLRQVEIISQVDRKFIACVIGLDHDGSSRAEGDGKASQDGCLTDGRTLILIDQHAADERVRVERYLKSICRGFLSYQEGSGGVEMRQLSPPVPVLLARHEASRLVGFSNLRKAFESWGFRFSGLEEIQTRLDCETQPDGGYIQVSVSAVPKLVSEKLLLGKEMQELFKGYIAVFESEPCEPSIQRDSGSSDEETRWLKALRWCPRGLLDLINSKACRGAIMFNDPLSTEQCERLVKQLSTTAFPFQCAHGRPSLIPLMRLSGTPEAAKIEWEKVASL